MALAKVWGRGLDYSLLMDCVIVTCVVLYGTVILLCCGEASVGMWGREGVSRHSGDGASLRDARVALAPLAGGWVGCCGWQAAASPRFAAAAPPCWLWPGPGHTCPKCVDQRH